MQAQTSSSSGVTTGGPDSDVASVDELPVDDKNKGKTLNSQKNAIRKTYSEERTLHLAHTYA